MKKIIFVMIAVLTVSFASTGYTAPKLIKDIKSKIVKKDDKKDKKKTAEVAKKDQKTAAPVSTNVVLAKGIKISWCGNDVADDGSVTIPGLEGLTLPVIKGMFDLTLPLTPVFGDEWGLNQQKGYEEMDFGTAKVYQFRIMYFSNSNTTKSREETADGRGGLPFKIYYSDSDVKGAVDGKTLELKKGWNIVGDKSDLTASLMCAG